MSDYPSDHTFWNPIFVVFFVFLIVAVYLGLSRDQWFLNALYTLDFFDLVVVGLATLRLIRLITFDKVMYFFRILFLEKRGDEYVRPEAGFNRAVTELIECIWCTGLWAALMMLGLYLIGPFGVFVVYVFAISAVGTVLQNLSHMIVRIGGGSGH